MKCKFFEVLYKFTCKFSGREPCDLARKDGILKRAPFCTDMRSFSNLPDSLIHLPREINC